MPIFISKKTLELEVARRTSDACDQVTAEMGAELHDDLIQKLSIFRLYIDRIERSLADPQEIQSLTIKMKSEFEQVIRAVKATSRRLLPTNIEDESLADILNILCQNMSQPGTANIHFEHRAFSKPLGNNIKMHLLRIVQELIHNALKHSSAWHIWVRLKLERNILIIEVEDDGTGVAKVSTFIDKLKKKNNTLKMRAQMIEATIDYLQGVRGLLAKVTIHL
jgi:signal transduction histidine kinase